MDVDKENINKLSDDELFSTMKKCGLNVGPITSTTRSIYEKKLRTYLDTSTNLRATMKSIGSISKSQKELKQQREAEEQQKKHEEEMERQQERAEELERERQQHLREQRMREEELRQREEELRRREEELERQRQREEELRKREREIEREMQRQREQKAREEEMERQRVQRLREEEIERQRIQQRLREEELERQRVQRVREEEMERQRLHQRLREEEMERQRVLKIREEEKERQRLQKLHEEEMERQRVLKIREEEKERQRLQKLHEDEMERQQRAKRLREEEMEKQRQREQKQLRVSNIPVRDPLAARSNSKETQSIYPALPNSSESIGMRAKLTGVTHGRGQYQDSQGYERTLPSANHLRSIAISKEPANSDMSHFSNDYYDMTSSTSGKSTNDTARSNLTPAPRDKFAERLNSYGLLKGDKMTAAAAGGNNSLYTSVLSSPTGIRARPPLHGEVDKTITGLSNQHTSGSGSLYNSDDVYEAAPASIPSTSDGANNSASSPLFQINFKYLMIVLAISVVMYLLIMQIQNNPANPVG